MQAYATTNLKRICIDQPTTTRYRKRTNQRVKIITTWHKTTGNFAGWITTGTPPRIFATIQRPLTTLYIPFYDLDKEDRTRMLAQMPLNQEQP